MGDSIIVNLEPWGAPPPPKVDYLATRMWMRHLVYIEDRCWTIVEVFRDGSFVAYIDEPYYDRPGCALHRRFSGFVLAGEIQRRWDDDHGW